MCDGLVLANRLAELAALPSINRCLLKLTLHHTHMCSKQTGSFPLHRSLEDVSALSLTPQQVGCWYAAFIQVDLASGSAGQTHLAKWFTDSQPLSILLHDKCSYTQVPMSRIR